MKKFFKDVFGISAKEKQIEEARIAAEEKKRIAAEKRKAKREKAIESGYYRTTGRQAGVRALSQGEFALRESLENKEKIFDKHFTTKGSKGTGVGLYIAKTIIEIRYFGRIRFDTKEDKTCFQIQIPIK